MKLPTITSFFLLWQSISASISVTNDDTSCQDDVFFRYNRKTDITNDDGHQTYHHGNNHLRNTKLLRDCEWIHRDASERCDLKIDFETAAAYCPVTCHQCTARPNVVTSSIQTDSFCYQAGPTRQTTQIKINFENAHPALEDWIAIYYANDFVEGADHLPYTKPIAWSYMTGNQSDMTKAKYGEVTIEAYLRPGKSYKAVLARNGDRDGPYVSVAKSDVFEFTTHHACAGRRQRERELTTQQQQQKLFSCSTELKLNQPNFVVGEDIIVDMHAQTTLSTNSCFMQISSPDAFVAIYEADISNNKIWGDNNYETFLWTCGDQGCHNSSIKDQITFASRTTSEQWPLKAGKYRAHLIVPSSSAHDVDDSKDDRRLGRRRELMESIAQSPVFTIIEEVAQVES